MDNNDDLIISILSVRSLLNNDLEKIRAYLILKNRILLISLLIFFIIFQISIIYFKPFQVDIFKLYNNIILFILIAFIFFLILIFKYFINSNIRKAQYLQHELEEVLSIIDKLYKEIDNKMGNLTINEILKVN
jgi:magnesium-transporting ATPase (P-type)